MAMIYFILSLLLLVELKPLFQTRFETVIKKNCFIGKFFPKIRGPPALST